MTSLPPPPPNAVIDQNGCFSALRSDEPVSENITARLNGERISYYLPERPITDDEVAAIQEHYATHGTAAKFFEAYSRWPVRSWVKDDHPFPPSEIPAKIRQASPKPDSTQMRNTMSFVEGWRRKLRNDGFLK
jgi:hypothetical protein